MKIKPKVFFCHKCERLLGSDMYLLVKTELMDAAFCSTCVREGYRELLQIQNKSPQIKKILFDFKRFIKKFKMEVES